MLVDIAKLKGEIDQYQDKQLNALGEDAKEIAFQISTVTWFILCQYDAELEKVIDQRVQAAMLHAEG